MIKDFLVSFTDNFKEKAKNPFLGTYVLVWLLRNWNLVYSLFYFDSKMKLSERTEFIKQYFKEQGGFVSNLAENIYWSFGVLILTYLLLNISRLIVNLSEKRLTPYIYKITDSKSIVLRNEYDRVRAENDDLQIRLEKEREAKSRLEMKIKNLESEIVEIVRLNSEQSTELDDDSKRNNLAIDSRTTILIEKMHSKNVKKEFVDICIGIEQGNSIQNDYEHLNFFLQLGVIIIRSNPGGNKKYYKVTEAGQKVLDILRLEV